MKIDGYTKFILTVIAVSLLLIAFQPIIFPKAPIAHAGSEVVNVNIQSLGGSSLYGSQGIPVTVNLDSMGGSRIYGSEIPVKISNIRDLR